MEQINVILESSIFRALVWMLAVDKFRVSPYYVTTQVTQEFILHFA